MSSARVSQTQKKKYCEGCQTTDGVEETNLGNFFCPVCLKARRSIQSKQPAGVM